MKLGVIINPRAGLGGALALKGSDDPEVWRKARAAGAQPRARERMQRALEPLTALRGALKIYCFAGEMGERLAREMGFEVCSVGAPAAHPSTGEDTRRAARALQTASVDLLLFAGGDGTARDIADAVGCQLPVLGVPAGVKIHSGVYATTPEAAGVLLKRLASGQWTALVEREVRDIDERAFNQGRVRARHYAELMVPEAPDVLQQVKNSGAAVDELAQMDVAAEVVERMRDDTLYLIGPGSTTGAVLDELGLAGTLLGVDMVKQRSLVACDVAADDIRRHIADHDGPVVVIVTAIGGQGHILGRGNQQLAADIIAALPRESLWVIATPDKLKALQGRPLLVDSNDPALDRALSGVIPVITGYHQQVLYPVES